MRLGPGWSKVRPIIEKWPSDQAGPRKTIGHIWEEMRVGGKREMHFYLNKGALHILLLAFFQIHSRKSGNNYWKTATNLWKRRKWNKREIISKNLPKRVHTGVIVPLIKLLQFEMLHQDLKPIGTCSVLDRSMDKRDSVHKTWKPAQDACAIPIKFNKLSSNRKRTCYLSD